VTKEQVEGAPHYSPDQPYDWDADNGRRIYDYYGVPPYWL
ncbi:PRC-barrel domain containing protein, partial [Rhizobiaceae sp. 2RAB30]